MQPNYILSRNDGHRLPNVMNRELDERMSYQTLLHLNEDLKTENIMLKDFDKRLGKALKDLHYHFQFLLSENNEELFKAINDHPILNKYELILTPLLDCYQNKIIKYSELFETIKDEFLTLEKKFEEITKENETLKLRLSDKIKENIQLYRDGNSSRLSADFGQLILEQTNNKQKVIVEENCKMSQQNQKYKSECERARKELSELKERELTMKSKLREYEISQRQQQAELKALKESSFNLQVKSSELQSQKRKLVKDLERASSQLNQLNREKDACIDLNEKLRHDIQNNIELPTGNADQLRKIQELQHKLDILESQQVGDDMHKRNSKLQKELEGLTREKNKLKESLDAEKIRSEELTVSCAELRKNIDKLQGEKMLLETSEIKNKKELEQLAEKCKNDLVKLRKAKDVQMEQLEDELNKKVQAKHRKIEELEDNMNQLRLERDKLEKEKAINSVFRDPKSPRANPLNLTAEKLKEKLTINEELFMEQIQLLENDNSYLRKELQSYQRGGRDTGDQNRKLRQELQKTKKELAEVSEQKALIIEEIKRVKNDYEGNLKEKEKIFDQKIREIRAVVEESERKRKIEREKTQEAARQYNKVLNEIKIAYEERIRVLEART